MCTGRSLARHGVHCTQPRPTYILSSNLPLPQTFSPTTCSIAENAELLLFWNMSALSLGFCQINSRSLLTHYECKVNSFDPAGECLRVGRTVSGWAKSGSFCDRNFCRQLTNFLGQSRLWPLVFCGLSSEHNLPPWSTVYEHIVSFLRTFTATQKSLMIRLTV